MKEDRKNNNERIILSREEKQKCVFNQFQQRSFFFVIFVCEKCVVMGVCLVQLSIGLLCLCVALQEIQRKNVEMAIYVFHVEF